MRKINFSIALVVISGSFFLFGCQSGQTKESTKTEILAEFDIPIDSNLILLPVTFQGKEYQFLLDTGAKHLIYDDSFKDKLRKMWLGPITMKGRTFDGQMFDYVRLPAPETFLGQMNMKVSKYVMVTETDKIRGNKEYFQGIIGMDLLKKYIVQIDFDEGKVIFFKAKKDFDLFSIFKPKENKHPEWGEAITLKTKIFSNIRYVNVKLPNNIRDDFLVDTGWCFNPPSLKSKIFDKVLSYNNPKDKRQDANSTPAGFSGYVPAQVIDEFSVGSFKYENNIFMRNYISILGLPFLSRHLVTFDFQNNMMYLKKGKNFDKQSNVNAKISFIAGCLLESENHVISSVDPNGPAYQKGVRNGDILIKICDQDISNMSFTEFFKFITQFSVPEDGKVPLIFKRGEETFKVEFVRKNGK
ncbi:MAG: aspartyl protease family protein [Sedimentisphaerales bacterium]|nr:aspartyl protease family protein [Sedimentisphaerales bacterium]